MKKIIALSCRDRMVNNTEGYYAQQSYMNALTAVNADYIAIVPTKDQNYDFVANMCDGLVVCGGGDIDAKYFHEENHESVGLVKDSIDIMDFKLVEAFLKVKKPILGICRGHQVLNVYYGGSLIQDIPSQYDSNLKHSQKEERHVGTHEVILTCDSCLGNKDQVIKVNTFHHQAIKDLGKTLKVTAISTDGIIEGIENDDVIGVQWHPECMINEEVHLNIFRKFMERIIK